MNPRTDSRCAEEWLTVCLPILVSLWKSYLKGKKKIRGLVTFLRFLSPVLWTDPAMHFENFHILVVSVQIPGM